MRSAALVLGIGLFALGCGGGATTGAPAAGTPALTSRSSTGFGVLLMAHGGTKEWNQGVIDSVQPLREKYDVEVAFGMADAASIQEGVKKLEARGAKKVGVVRLFVSGESWFQRTEQILGIRAGAPAEDPTMAAAMAHGHGAHHAAPGAAGGHGGHSMASFKIDTKASFAVSKDGLADATTMGLVLADRAAALSKAPAKEDVIVLAHGPGDDGENSRWLAKLDDRAKDIRAKLPFRRVQVETLREDWPEKRVDAEKRIRAYVERAKAEGGTAIVIPFRVQGFGPYKSVLEGLDYTSDGTGLVPHAEVTKWIEQQIVALEGGAFKPVL